MLRLIRRGFFLAAVLLVGLTATATAQPASDPADMALGRRNAPVTLIEYASVTCPHCRHFHETVWSQLKAAYVDTGKVRFIYRELPTAPAPVALAGFQIARCNRATPQQYFERLGVLYEAQTRLLSSQNMEEVRVGLVSIGAGFGLSEEQVMACITDHAGVERVQRVVGDGVAQFNIQGTPALILNGQLLDQVADPSVVTFEGLSRLIDGAISAHHRHS